MVRTLGPGTRGNGSWRPGRATGRLLMSEQGEAVKLQEYATKEQIEFFDRLRSGNDPVHEEARTELVELANELLNILAYPVDRAAAAYVARMLLDNPDMKLWSGERSDRPEGAIDDGDIRIHVVGDTGVMEFYHVLDVMARLLVLAGRGDRVIAQDHDDGPDAEAASQVAAIDLDAIADPDVKAAVQLVADAQGAPAALAIYRAIAGIAKDDKATQIQLLGKAVLA
jgi:hypothetical protein